MDRDKSVTREKVNIDSLLSCLHDSETGDPHLQVIGFAMEAYSSSRVSKLFEKKKRTDSFDKTFCNLTNKIAKIKIFRHDI